ncbi:hypothetical protein [Paenibacillus pabuli]|uniref:hypothetical protein n=1 Tax=Paenibacillus pabuli TaxID=1472 RepID=UPI001FFFF4E9|nr:hypothetical protein [Paenibacillus pabuli]UPK42451.1 hypothetical protein KET34_25170 [Paenibacillus pabuli]
MPLPSSIHSLQMAHNTARYMRDRGYWEDCTPEDILRLADTYKELEAWEKFVWAYYKMHDYFYSLSDVINPEDGQTVVIVESEKKMSRYRYKDDNWKYVQDETPF